MTDDRARRGNSTVRLALVVGLTVGILLAAYSLLKIRSSTAASTQAAKVEQAGVTATRPLAAGQTSVGTTSFAAKPTGIVLREFDIAVNPYAAALREQGKSKRAWPADFLQQQDKAAVGDAIQFELTGGVMASGLVKIVQRDDAGIKYMSGELSAPETGKFFFLRPPEGGKAGSAVGVIQLPESKIAYRIEPTGDNGSPELWQRRMDEVVCMSMQEVDESELHHSAEAPPLRPDLVPDYIPSYNSNIVSLQSLPGARGVILLDFFGGYTASWDGVYYSAPNVGNAAVKDLWKRVAEDYMPLNINVTTDRKVFESAPEGSRQRCVFAPDAPTPAGVAFIGSWNWGGDTVCWAKYTTGKSGAEVGSHEVGHTLGLAHQTQDPPGTNDFVDYYGGHNGPGNTGWAPIMGVGYYQPVATWAKGEYLYAAEPQDELATMLTYNNVVYRTDDAGSNLLTSRYLEIYSNSTASAEGVIETTGDTDAFQFTTTGGTVNLTANPVGDWANLAVMVTLADASDTIIATNNPQNTLAAAINTSVSAGTYTFKVTGTGRNSPLTNGFSSYGSLGYYSVTGSVAGVRLPNRFTVAERSPNGTVVGTITSTNGHVMNYVITAGNSNNAFALDNSGVLTVANSGALLYANLGYGTQMTVQYELFVNIIDTEDPLQTELNRRVIVQVIDMPEPATQMIHRWSFANNTDSISGANATVLGTATISGGKLNIPGGSARANCATVNLTNTLRTNVSLTVEGWFTMNTLQDWSKLWMFGRPNGGTEPGLAYMEFTPRAGANGGVPSMSFNTGLRNYELNTRVYSNPPLMTTGVEYHVVSVYDAASNQMSLYINGQLADSAAMVEGNITQLAATEAYFGAAVNYGDANLNGAINEMRIYNGPLSAQQVALDYASGPDNVVTNTGALLAVRLVVANTNMVSLASQPVSVFADYANITNVNVTTLGAVVTAGNSNIISTENMGVIRAFLPGTTTVTASFGGTNASRVITVTNLPTVLAHRWSFANGTDSVGGATAALIGTASFSGGQLVLPGGPARSNCATVVITNTLNSTVDLTVEAWFTVGTQQNWSKLWMFGKVAGEAGDPWLSAIEFTPRAGVDGNVPSMAFNPVNGNEVNSRGGANPPLMTNGGSYYVACTYNSASNLMSMYINGALADSAPMGNGNIAQLNPDPKSAYFGAPVYYGDQCFIGSIDELRIWKGALTASQVALNASAGPNSLATNAGALSGVRLVITTNVMARGTTQQCNVFADFTNSPSLNVTSNGTIYASSNPNIVAVNTTGLLSAVGAGTATVTASYGGSNDTKSITVTGAPVLAHRWSFNDGTDSVGGANATLVGSASYSGGKLLIPGGSARVNAATANINATLAANRSITIEGWFTMNSLQNWAKIWMFGTPNGGTQPGLSYIDFTPRRGDGSNVPSISIDSVSATEVNTSGGANPAIMSQGVEYYAAAVYNAVNNTMSLYINGSLVDSASMNGADITQLQATEAWFGAPVYWPDPNLNGAINEMRIWDGPLTGAQVSTNYNLGPNALPRPTIAVVTSGTDMTLSWPATFPTFTLQSSPVIGEGAVWTPVSPAPVISGNVYTVTLPTTAPASFFRLVQ